MAIDWEDVRYRGDAADVREMFETYRVEDYLDAFEENVRQHDLGLREQLLTNGIRLTRPLSPRIFDLFAAVCGRLEIEAKAEVFCVPSADVNAFAAIDVRKGGTNYLVGVTAAALERLTDPELASILGHEMGHFLFGNNRLQGLISTDRNNPSATVLPALGESLFLRWRKKAEISADRAGLLACGDLEAAGRALLKATFGLSERNLNLDITALLAQVDEVEGHPELMEATFASHPLLPIRLKALELFSRSEKAARNGFASGRPGRKLSDEALEGGVDDLVRLTRRYPYEELHKAVMQVVALGGALLLSADGDVSDEEVKILVQILHRWFTDEPEAEIVTDRKKILELLPPAAAKVKRDGDDGDKMFVLTRLAEVALADGALVESESAVVHEIAERIGVPAKSASSILIAAAQAVGFKSDVKLNRLSEKLRRSLQTGFRGATR
jgi:uncharacterized tellurite resistance protein B-like protein